MSEQKQSETKHANETEKKTSKKFHIDKGKFHCPIRFCKYV